MKTKVLLKKGEGRTINAGGLWIYDNEIKENTWTFQEWGYCGCICP